MRTIRYTRDISLLQSRLNVPCGSEGWEVLDEEVSCLFEAALKPIISNGVFAVSESTHLGEESENSATYVHGVPQSVER